MSGAVSEYKVFLSCKSSDRPIAETMDRELGPYAPDLTFILAPKTVTEGESWREQLITHLRTSDSLFVIYTPAFQYDEEEARTNDWLLYEAGLKSTLDSEPDPVICFYPQGQNVPKPVEHLQGVEASRDSLRRFLDRFFRTTEITRRERPLNQKLDDRRLEEIADKVSAAFRIASTRRRYVAYRLSITLPETMAIAGDDHHFAMPRQAIVSGDAASLDVFGRTESCTWGELTSEYYSREVRWLEDLDAAFNAAIRGRRPPPATGTFRDARGRILKPTLYRVDWADDTMVGVRLLFTVEQEPAYFGGTLFNILRLTERYKAEIFGHFLEDELVGAKQQPERLPDVLERLKASLRTIRNDARTRTLFSREKIVRSFSDDEDRKTVMDLREEWQHLYDELWEQLATAENEPVEADVVGAKLVALRRNNDETAAVTARQYLRLLENSASS